MEVRLLSGEERFQAMLIATVAFHMRMEDPEKAVRRTEQSGIIFLDEIDKIASRGNSGGSPEVSREGVQRDLLPEAVRVIQTVAAIDEAKGE